LLRSIGKVLFGKILPRYAYPVIRGPLRGKKFILGTLGGKGGGGTVYFNMLEPEQTAAFAKSLKPSYTFFDVGANVGYYTVLGSKLVGDKGKVIAFEPLVRNISYLYRHIVLNKLKNVILIPSACADEISLATFSAGPNTAMGHISENNGNNDKTEEKLTVVPVLTLDAVAEKLNCKPNVLKIDVEGAEVAVLHGAQNILRQAKPKIFLSVHSDVLKSQCLEYLYGFNYKCEPLDASFENAREFYCFSNQ